jgi:hypothetical protein
MVMDCCPARYEPDVFDAPESAQESSIGDWCRAAFSRSASQTSAIHGFGPPGDSGFRRGKDSGRVPHQAAGMSENNITPTTRTYTGYELVIFKMIESRERASVAPLPFRRRSVSVPAAGYGLALERLLAERRVIEVPRAA